MGKINQEVIIGPDTTNLVIHNIYPNGLEYPKHMLDPNIGGYSKCKHIYEYVGTKVCPVGGPVAKYDGWRAVRPQDVEVVVIVIDCHDGGLVGQLRCGRAGKGACNEDLLSHAETRLHGRGSAEALANEVPIPLAPGDKWLS